MLGTLLEKLFIQVGADLSDLDGAIDKSDSKIDNFSRSSQRSFSKMGDRFAAVGRGMLKTGAVMTAAITGPLAIFAKHATDAAIDAEEMNSAFDVVFGDMSQSMREWAEETGNAMSRSTQEVQRGALAFQELFGKALAPEKAAEMSKQFAVLTQDLASFKNLSNEVAQQKLFSGLTGEAEPLRAVGVFINDAAVQAKALELGLEAVNGKFTDQQKIVARAALIREQLAQADGDVIRTSDSAANKIKASKAAYEELSVTVGNTLVPALTPLIEALTSMLEAFNTLPSGVQTVIVAVAAFAAILGPIITIIGALITGATAVVAALGGWPLIISTIGLAINTFLLSPIGLVVLAIAAVVAAFVYWEDIKKIVTDVGSVISDWYTENVKPTVDKVMAVLQPFIDFFKGTFGAAIEGVINVVSALLKGDFSGAWEAAKEAAFTMLQALMNLMAEVGPVILNALRGIYEGAKKWLLDKLGQVWGWVVEKVTWVKDAFFDLYDAVVGNSYIPDMVERIGEEMSKLQALMVDPALKATSAVDETFANLANRTENLLSRLFPLAAQVKAINEDLATLDEALAAGQISVETYEAGKARLENERNSARREASGPLPVSVAGTSSSFKDMDVEGLLDQLIELPPIATKAELALQDFGQSMGDALMFSLRSAIDGKNFFDTLKTSFQSVLGNIMQQALSDLESAIFGKQGLGGFLGTALSSLFGASTSRAVGGPMVAGQMYDVGLGEKAIASANGRILSRSDAMASMGGGKESVEVSVTPSPLFNVEVRRVADNSASAAVRGYDGVVGSRVQKNLRRK